MPTLTTTSVPAGVTSVAPPALTLSFGGVDFELTPSNGAAEVSYKWNSEGVILSLGSFSGSMQVSLRQGTDTTTTSATVEEEPHSPEIVCPASPKGPTVGQKKLQFRKANGKKEKGKTARGTSKTPERKRPVESKPPKAPVKKRRENDNERAPTVRFPGPDKFPSLIQTGNKGNKMSQLMSDIPDFSQTQTTAEKESREEPTPAIQSATSEEKARSNTVQDILDSVDNSNESVATVVDDENSIPPGISKEGAQLLIEEGDDNDQPKVKQDDNENKPPSPCARWGHSMTNIKEDRLLVYGGQSFDQDGNPVMLSDVHVYDITNRQWQKPINCSGEAKQWHSANYLPDRRLLITFGGEMMDKSKKPKLVASDTLRVLDTDIMLWYPPAVSGDIPTGRSGHTATLLPNTNELVLFGGVKGSKWLNSVSVLDTRCWVWTMPKIQGAAPKPRSYHSTTAVQGQGNNYKLVIFGGNGKTCCYDTVHVLETSSEDNWKWSHPTVTGKAPFPRTGHSATLLEDGKTICVYGGWDPNEEDATGAENIFKTSFYLDTSTWTWGKGPNVVPGGNGCDDSVMEDCGSKRCGHASVLNPQNGEVITFGGRIPGERLADDFQLLTSDEKPVGLNEMQS